MGGYKKHIIIWTEDHQKVVYATSEDGALTDAMICPGDPYTCIKRKDFRVIR